MTKKFAKLYETERGQIVVMRQNSEECAPEIRMFFDADAYPVGMCSIALQFPDTAEGESQADEAFSKLTQADAEHTVFAAIDQIKGMTGDTNDQL